jgi:uncharacterized protein YggU (UPF0235/DUF167 family)
MHVKVKVFPAAPVDEVEKVADDQFRIFVKAPAESGLANHRAQQLLAETLHVQPHQLRLVSGHKHQHKIFQVVERI